MDPIIQVKEIIREQIEKSDKRDERESGRNRECRSGAISGELITVEM